MIAGFMLSCAAWVLTASVALPGEGGSAFEGYASSFLEAHELSDDFLAKLASRPPVDASVTDPTMMRAGLKFEKDVTQQLLEEAYYHLPLGLFDAYYPKLSFEGRSATKEVKRVQALAGTLLDLQQRWNRWVMVGLEETPELPDLRPVRKWIKKWSSKKFRNGEVHETRPSELDQFADFMRTGRALGLNRESSATPLIFAPDREGFLGISSLLGKFHWEAERDIWKSSLPVWTHFARRGLGVVALEYADHSWQSQPFQGAAMNAREKTGELQHVQYYATDYLRLNYLGDQGLDRTIALGLAVKMPVETLGENNSRGGGGRAGGNKGPISKFVPQGMAPPRPQNADSYWRTNLGKEFFLKDVRGALQKDGTFRLTSKSGSHHAFAGPILGVQAEALPPEFLEDGLEALRAISAAMVHWMQHEVVLPQSVGKVKATEAFARLLRRSAAERDAGAERFDELLMDCYGMDRQQLESDFVRWLAGRKKWTRRWEKRYATSGP